MKIAEHKRLVLIGLSVAITQWAHDRRIIALENAKGQYMKLVSEFGEVCKGFRESNKDEIKDGIGDTFVMLNNVAAIMGGEIIGLMNLPFEIEKSREGGSFYFDAVSFTEKLGFLADYVAKNQRDEALETLGWLANQLVFISTKVQIDFVECVQLAYDEIKHRRGVMYGGVFVKESDARYPGIMQELEMQDLDESRTAQGLDA